MKLPNKLWLRILIGAVLIFAAAGISLLIKEGLDEQDPETSLPVITVSYEGAPLPGVYRAGYEWSFFTTIAKNTPLLRPEDIPLIPVDMHGDTQMDITFSRKPTTLKVSIAEGQYSNIYSLVDGAESGTLYAPQKNGTYVYKVEASWKTRGSIIYYYCVHVI